MRSLMTLTVNGERREVAVPVHRTLLEVLREDLGLPGDQARLRAGRVRHVHGARGRPAGPLVPRARRRVPGRRDPDRGGPRRGRELHPLQQAFAELGAAQCGYCTPGILLTAQALLDATPRPDRDADPGRAGRQPLPLHRVHEDPRRGRAGRRPDGAQPGREPRRWLAAREPPLLGRRAPPAQGRRLGEGDRRDPLRRRPRPPAHGVREDPPRPASARPHPGDRHHARGRGARRLRGDHGPGLPAGPVRDHAGDPGRGAALRREGAVRGGPGGGRRRRGRGDRRGRRAADRRRVRAARLAHVDRRGAPRRHLPDPRVRGRPQHPQAGVARVRRRGGGVPRGRPGPRGRVLLRGEHAPPDGAARGRRPVDAGREAHPLVLDPDPALRPPGAREGPRDADEPRPGHRDAERRRVRREVRSLQPRDGRGAARPAHGAAGQDHAHARGGLLHAPRPPPGPHVGPVRASGRTARSWRSTSGPGSTAARTARTASRRRSTRARSRP